MTAPKQPGPVLELASYSYADFNFTPFPGCCALQDGRGIVAAVTGTGAAPTGNAWLIDPNGIVDHLTWELPPSENTDLITAPLIGGPGVVIAVQTGPSNDRQIVGINIGDTALTIAYTTTDTTAPSGTYPRPGDSWVTDGRLYLGTLPSNLPPYSNIPTTQDVYDAHTGELIGRGGPYEPQRTATPAVYLAEMSPVDEWDTLYMDVTVPTGATIPAYIAPDVSWPGLERQPVGNGVLSLAGGNTGCVSQAGSTGVFVNSCFYAFPDPVEHLIAFIVTTERPPLRQRQRSDGLAASGAPRQHQRSTLQTSNRQRAVR